MGIFSNTCPTCGDDCACVNPAVQLDDCNITGNIELSEVRYITLDCPSDADKSIPKSPVTGYADSSVDDTANEAALLSWWAAIDNSVAGGIKRLKVIGSIPPPEEVPIAMPDGEEEVILRTYTLTARVPNADQVTRNYLKWVQGCNTKMFLTYGTRGCGHYGGENGIKIKSIKAAPQHDEGNEAVVNWNLTIKYELKCEPDRDFLPV